MHLKEAVFCAKRIFYKTLKKYVLPFEKGATFAELNFCKGRVSRGNII